MKIQTKILLLFALINISYIPEIALSQKIEHSEGTSEVRLEQNMTKEETKEKAEMLAKINAIENIFNTYVEQVTDTRVKDGRVNFDIIAGTRVRGEWIRTIKSEFNEEVRTIKGQDGLEQELWITCKIKGEVREVVNRADIDFSTLNCPLIQCRRNAFFNNEDIFLYFKSPVEGYLSVFLDDGENTYRLLPYKSMGTLSAVRVKGDKGYIFFSRDKELQYDPQFATDALELYTDMEIEYNNIYIVFAENSYIKPILDNIKELEDGYLIPRSLKSGDFYEWMADCRAEMTDFQAVRVKISIEK